MNFPANRKMSFEKETKEYINPYEFILLPLCPSLSPCAPNYYCDPIRMFLIIAISQAMCLNFVYIQIYLLFTVFVVQFPVSSWVLILTAYKVQSKSYKQSSKFIPIRFYKFYINHKKGSLMN